MEESTKRTAVVTGGNRGIGFSICKQLSSNGLKVVLTARDEKKGLEAVGKLKELALCGEVVFHQLDVTDSASIASFVEFITNQFGKLDILVNNAAIVGAHIDGKALASLGVVVDPSQVDWTNIFFENYVLAEKSLRTNYYGTKEFTKALVPLLYCSTSPKIVNVSSSMGRLEIMPNGRPKEVLSDILNLSEEKIDEILNEFLKDYKEGSLEAKGWPTYNSAYIVSKVGLNAYTRIMADKYPSFCVNAICPGYVKTDMNHGNGVLTSDEGAEPIVRLALLQDDNTSGLFFSRGEKTSF
ncbi:(+)-neomenthol dehydrogenase-like [Vicia villosa]|uniref:(+)-neomenthol dehydrogenase-like n=1 Tax=Vicia villosa TaxID=3911 RepID=UPI00273B5833|nr:(+)-neomenthol dehydrogenase-like [Vicia villosa]